MRWIMWDMFKHAVGHLRLLLGMPTAAAHQDKSRGGLGCHSLEVEYHLTCQQNLVRAMNDQGPRGTMTRALFGMQKTGVDVLTAEHTPSLQRYSLRMRQLLSLKQCKTRLLKRNKEHDILEDMNNLAETINTLLPTDKGWTDLLVTDTHTLHSLGVHNVEESY